MSDGKTWDSESSLRERFRDLLSPIALLPDDDMIIEELRLKLTAVERVCIDSTYFMLSIYKPPSMPSMVDFTAFDQDEMNEEWEKLSAEEIKRRQAVVKEIEQIMYGQLIDYTRSLEFLCGHLLAPGCSVILSPRQFEVLKVYLSHIQDVADDVNFQLEQCVDHRPAGYSVAWDIKNNQSWQDDFVDTVMENMTQSLGFYAGSILREGYLIDLGDIDAQIAEIRERVTERSRQRALDSIRPSDQEVTFTPVPRLEGQAYGELTDLRRSWIKAAHSAGASAQWIADQLNLPLKPVEQVISDSGT